MKGRPARKRLDDLGQRGRDVFLLRRVQAQAEFAGGATKRPPPIEPIPRAPDRQVPNASGRRHSLAQVPTCSSRSLERDGPRAIGAGETPGEGVRQERFFAAESR